MVDLELVISTYKTLYIAAKEVVYVMATSGDEERVVTVNIYDTHASNANFKVKPTTTAAEICKIILSKRDILSSESRFFSIVVVVTAFNATKKVETHCLRTLKPNETLIEVQQTIVLKMMEKCCIPDQSKVDNTAKWYFKDMRTNPIELGATSEICGEYDSDEDEIHEETHERIPEDTVQVFVLKMF